MGDSWEKHINSPLLLDRDVLYNKSVSPSCTSQWSSAHLASSEDGHITLTLPQEGQVTGGEVILLLSFACGQVKDTVSYPVTSFQNCVDSWEVGREKERKRWICLSAFHFIQILLLRMPKDLQDHPVHVKLSK